MDYQDLFHLGLCAFVLRWLGLLAPNYSITKGFLLAIDRATPQ